MKKTWLVLLSFLLLALPATVQAQSFDGYDYSINPGDTNTITITNYTGPGGVVTIPTNLNGLTVTSIGDSAFEGTGLTSVTIPGSVTSIGQAAFAYTSLTNVTIPNGVTSLGKEAFYECSSLTSVMIPGSVTNLGDEAFYECSSLGSVTIPGSVTSVGDEAFLACGLTNVTIGNGVTSIGMESFYLCTELSIITIPGSVAAIRDGAFEDCHALTGVYFQGNAPSADATVFSGDTDAIAYYDGGTIGWSSTFGGIPTVDLLAAMVITANPTNGGIPLTVSFTSANMDSAGHAVTNWTWTFGDGSTSAIQNPSHIYTSGGTFYVTLNETNSHGAPVAGAVTAITVSPLTVVFAAYPTSGVVPLTVNFFSANVDSASNTITSWSWTFGDGSTSTNQNPSHAYVTNGAFTPVLLATNELGGRVAGTGPASIVAALRTSNAPNISIQTTTQTVSNAAFTVAGTASDSVAVASVYFQLNGGAWTNATTTNTWTNWTAAVTLSPGTNTIAAYAVDTSSNVSVTNTVSVVYVPQTGSLQVTISPESAVTNGARWQVDTSAPQYSGAVVSGLSVGLHTVSFNAIAGRNIPSNQIVKITDGETDTITGVYTVTETEKPTLAITSPKSGQSVTGSNDVFTLMGTTKDKESVTNVYYQTNGGNWNSATTTNGWTNWTGNVTLSNGANTISAYAQDISGNLSAVSKVNFKFFPGGTLVVAVPAGEHGKVTPNDNGKVLGLGTNFTLTAVPGKNWIFSNWVASGSETFVSNNPVLKFTMQSNLVLQANFSPNLFFAAEGAYAGLFAPATSPREQTNSGSFTLSVTTSGSLSGDLYLGSATPIALSGKFGPDGTAMVTTTRPHANTLLTTLNLDTNTQTVTGMVSDGSFSAALLGYQSIFSTKNKAPYHGQYTMVIPGTTNSEVGPFGTSYGTVTVSSSGAITFVGSLADGTTVNRSSAVSKDGHWPFYLPLYSGQGSIYGWNSFTNNVTNGVITFADNASWINAFDTSKTALFHSGFTNTNMLIIGSAYNATAPLLALPSGEGEVLLEGGNLAANITNFIILEANDRITLTNSTDESNKLTLTITRSTGVVSGSFANPASPKETIKINGVVLQGLSNALGYFLGTNQSGTFLLESP